VDEEFVLMKGTIVKSGQSYKLSFTTGGLFLSESCLTASLYLTSQNWGMVRQQLKAGNLLQARTMSSGERVNREVLARLATLTVAELEVVANGAPQDRAHLMWIAATRRYKLIAEFAEEVVRERFLLLKPAVKYDDFDAFFLAKALLHEQLNALADSTIKKLRQNVFKMLRDAGLVSIDGYILHTMLSITVVELVAQRDPSEFRLFPLSDSDISRVVR